MKLIEISSSTSISVVKKNSENNFANMLDIKYYILFSNFHVRAAEVHLARELNVVTFDALKNWIRVRNETDSTECW